MKFRRKTYSDEEKAAALATLAAESGSVRKAARIVGVSPSTLRGWRDSPYQVAPEVKAEAVATLDSILESIATKIMTGLNKPEAIARLLCKPAQAAVVGAISIDKLLALRKGSVDESKVTLSDFLSAARWVEDEVVGRVSEGGRSRAQSAPLIEAPPPTSKMVN